MIYGILIDNETDAYIRSDNLDAILTFVPANERRGRRVTLAVLDPDCATCGEEVPGWHPITSQGEFVDLPMHDGCWADYLDEQHAGIYV